MEQTLAQQQVRGQQVVGMLGPWAQVVEGMVLGMAWVAVAAQGE